MNLSRKAILWFVVGALPLIGGCSSSTTSPPPLPTQSLYVGSFGTAPNIAEAFFPFSSSSTVTYSSPAALANTKGLAFDSAGNLYVATAAAQVFVFAHPVGSASTPTATINLPGGTDPLFIAIDTGGNLWVADSNGVNVYEFTGPFVGTSTPVPAKTLNTDIVSASGIAFDAAGNLYVADSVTGDIEIFAAPLSNGETPNAAKLTGAGNVREIAFDQSGNLYAGQFGGTILRYNAPTAGGGAPSITDASTGIASAYFLAIDAAGNLYVTDGLDTKNVYEFTAVAATFSSSSTPANTLLLSSFTSTANGLAVGPR
jgi:hypothetical protein